MWSLVNVPIADLQVLRDTARKATRMLLWKSEYREVARNEAIFFCFENARARVLFESYCELNGVPHRSIDD
jgi:hypothetical protein